MNNCWICYEKDENFLLLPYEDEYLDNEISIFKNTMIIKDITPFQFLYFICCNNCIENLIKCKYSGNIFKKIRNREIYGKKN
jgi:hypothetical protein|tara:strand:+ start:128 stop:373 length:246 start_codon:yes stop_codon:yes gene_type:complete